MGNAVVRPSLANEQELLQVIRDKEAVPLAFLNKRLESTVVAQAATFDWKLQLAGGIECPRFIVAAFQTGRGGNQTVNNASFDSDGLNVIDAYVTLNAR